MDQNLIWETFSNSFSYKFHSFYFYFYYYSFIITIPRLLLLLIFINIVNIMQHVKLCSGTRYLLNQGQRSKRRHGHLASLKCWINTEQELQNVHEAFGITIAIVAVIKVIRITTGRNFFPIICRLFTYIIHKLAYALELLV